MSANFAVSVTIRAIDEVTKTINKVTGNISKQGTSLKSFNSQIASVTTPRGLKESVSTLNTELSGIGKSLEMKRFVSEIEEGTGKAISSFKMVGSAAKTAFSGIATSGFVIGGLSLASNRMFSDISRSNIELKHQAAQLGTTPDKLRSYRLAAESVGAPQAGIDSAFGRINDMAFQFKVGNTAPSQSIAALNSLHRGAPISLLDEHQHQRSPELILREFAEKLNTSKLPQVSKVQFSNDFLGGSDLLPFLKLGNQGIQDRTAKFQGGEYEKSDSATARYLEATAHLNASLDTLKRLASIEILPGISKGLDGISNWISERQPQLKKLFKDIGDGIPREMNAALHWVNYFVQGLSLLSNTIGIANFAFTMLSVTVGWKLGGALWKIIQAFSVFKNSIAVAQGIGGITSLIAAFPFAATLAGYLAVIAVISAVTYAVVKYRKEIMGWIESAFSFLRSISPVFNAFVSVIGKAIEMVTNLFSLIGKPPTLKLETQGLQPSDDLTPFLKYSSNKNDFFGQIFNSNSGRNQKTSETKSAEVTVRFENLPKGTRIDEPKGSSWVNLFAGYSSIGETA